MGRNVRDGLSWDKVSGYRVYGMKTSRCRLKYRHCFLLDKQTSLFFINDKGQNVKLVKIVGEKEDFLLHYFILADRIVGITTL